MATARLRLLFVLLLVVGIAPAGWAQTLTVSVAPSAPSIPEGSSLALVATPSEATGVTLQWSRDGSVLTGETGAMLLVDNLRFGDAGAVFSVVATRTSDGATASAATSPLDITVNLGTDFVVQTSAARGPGTLREAVNLTQTSQATAGVPRIVTFAAGLSGAVIPWTTDALIDSDQQAVVDATALAAGVTLDAGGTRRHFTLTVAGNLELRRLSLINGNGSGALTSGSGGAIYSEGALRLVACIIRNCTATTGGAVFHVGDPLSVIGSVIRDNASTGAGGGLVATGGQISVQSTSFIGNSAQGNSGGLRVAVGANPAVVSVSDCLFLDNSSGLSAGGASFNGVDGSSFSLTRSRFERNVAAVAGGGLLHFVGDLQVTDSSFVANTATSGGGAYLQSGGNVALTQCTIGGNVVSTSAGGSGAGGGLFVFRGSAVLRHCTVAGNSALGAGSTGAGLQLQAPAALDLGNSILAGNSTPDDTGADLNFTGGTVVAGEANLIGNNDSVQTVFPAGALAGTLANPLDPRLDAVGLHGGNTLTAPPLDGSAALDAATGNTSPTLDQRGFPRAVGAASDLGAVERGPVVTVASTAGSGPGSLRAAIDAATGDTRIRLDASLSGQTVALTGSALVVPAGRVIEINASNLPAGLKLTGSTLPRVFDVAAGGALTLRRVAISATAQAGAQPGVAVRSFGGVTLTECDLGGIVTDGEASCLFVGGGIASIERSTFGRGSASGGNGGAIVVDGSDTQAWLVNSTIADHQGSGAGRAGGLTVRNGAFASLLHVTLTNCSGGTGAAGGLYLLNGAEARLERSILAANTGGAGADINNSGSTVTAAGPNLLGVNATVSAQFPAGPLVGTAAAPLPPRLSALGSNGGFTPTAFPQIGSPALDAAGTSPLAVDQRGQPRGNLAKDDLGAVEVGLNDPASTRLINVSTRLRAGTGTSVPIAGFAIRGGPKKVAIRVLGPTLAAFGVPEVLANPTLQLVRQSDGATLATNDDWQTDAASAQELTNANLALPNARESGLVATLAEGTYTAIVRGVSDGTGNCLVEVYDLDRAASPRLVNLSTRGPAGLGDNAMIAGLVVGPGQTKRVVVRSLGPTLTAFGVSGALQDPTIEVRDANGAVIASNDDWQSTQSAELAASGFAPPDSREPAVLLNLNPGSYTAIVRGKNNTQGNAIVEVYELQ
ncbi:MAG: hypothetical protein JSR82_02090 [Verrucomicrobia bacterium]|nr:hypothetical protein [Verrucomicrobiota bacterium]